MDRFVDISFDCLPLRSIGRMDVPLDASPKFRAKCERIKSALERHGSLNTYYLHNAKCVFHLTNAPDLGMLEFEFDGVVTTNEADDQTLRADLDVRTRLVTVLGLVGLAELGRSYGGVLVWVAWFIGLGVLLVMEARGGALRADASSLASRGSPSW